MEIMSARKNEPRGGNTREEKELSLSRALRRYFQVPATQANGCQKLELVLLRAWQTKAVKEKFVKLQLKYGSLSRF